MTAGASCSVDTAMFNIRNDAQWLVWRGAYIQ
jgi:hypothetical protein